MHISFHFIAILVYFKMHWKTLGGPMIFRFVKPSVPASDLATVSAAWSLWSIYRLDLHCPQQLEGGTSSLKEKKILCLQPSFDLSVSFGPIQSYFKKLQSADTVAGAEADFWDFRIQDSVTFSKIKLQMD